MTDSPADNPAFPLEKAAQWISDWRGIGGGFWVRETEGEVSVQLARTAIDANGSADIHALAAFEMEKFLLINPALKMAVMVLARDAWEKSLVREVGLDPAPGETKH